MHNMKTYYTAQLAEMFDTTSTTVYRWSEALEAEGYQYLLDDRGARAYREIDIEAIKRFMELRQENRMRVETAAKQVVEEFAGRVQIDLETFEKRKMSLSYPDDPEQFMEFFKGMAMSYQEVIQTNREIAQELLETRQELMQIKSQLMGLPESTRRTNIELEQMKQQLIDVPNQIKKDMEEKIHKNQTDLEKLNDSVKQVGELRATIEEIASSTNNEAEMRTMIRAVQFDIRMAELEVTNRLKKQAQDEWNRLPEGERYRKKGLFGKEEDLGKRELFIQRYIEDNLANEMAKTKER
ncbi:helix-turn-helix domain-containing protein [Brevibacillus laterosporus]|uniref:helix-turn-helix domain-containing protein n=1 Tax=Brevibacillus laterosporus TaxID=1465 RepID=UPI0019571FA0|nr:helix-turn-helix domain-containing protein [Brevibacillus laterosporus]